MPLQAALAHAKGVAATRRCDGWVREQLCQQHGSQIDRGALAQTFEVFGFECRHIEHVAL